MSRLLRGHRHRRQNLYYTGGIEDTARGEQVVVLDVSSWFHDPPSDAEIGARFTTGSHFTHPPNAILSFDEPLRLSAKVC